MNLDFLLWLIVVFLIVIIYSYCCRGTKGCIEVDHMVKGEIEDFRKYTGLIQALRNHGMRNR